MDIEPSSLNVEPVGTDSTIFSWYYNFEMPNDRKINRSDKMINKESLLTQLDTTLSDYTIKYYEQLYLENQIYEPILVWVRNKSDILQASAIISNTSDEILMRKFVLFNDTKAPDPRAGFYISLIKNKIMRIIAGRFKGKELLQKKSSYRPSLVRKVLQLQF